MLKTQFSSLSFLANWRTILIYFFITPFVDMILLVLINAQYTGHFNWSIVLASIAIDATNLSMTTMTQSLITDANLGIDYEMIAQRPFSLHYWTNKVFVALIAGFILATSNLILALIFGAPLVIINRTILVLPLLCLFGIILGFTAWAISWEMNDPYFLSNLISSVMSLVAGILVVISAYPKWLEKIALLFPFYGPINLIKFKYADLRSSILVTIIWLIIGIITYIVQSKHVLKTRHHKYN
ncbi:antibiotic transporter permease [Lactobacillus bombicola]|uniref:Antibiotic transporter permease n=1 Tax=Lactobacillus bombicola TaxID=1505723 RepID=A0A396SZN9_9LACO|nr:antibiotic transporter permease [Lactobacillus bombicola]RHW49118.1 antibiotic transporter permease [Lactobacillus bombicola]RHW53429.1 antibiotic transporter permease [Lactobacillus bombicola]RHW54395.1 antibiotic transporter permease [Lactobacillus bombicola]